MGSVFLFLLKVWQRPFLKWTGFGLACCLACALLSHDPHDPSWNVATAFPVHNWMGQLGANWSDLFLQTFGIVAYTLPLFLLGLVFQKAPLPFTRLKTTLLYTAGVVLLTFGLGTIQPDPLSVHAYATPGGAFGKGLTYWIQHTFNLSATWMWGLSLSTSILGAGVLFISIGGQKVWFTQIAHLCARLYHLWRDIIPQSKDQQGILPLDTLYPNADVELEDVPPTRDDTPSEFPEEDIPLPPPLKHF